MVAHEHQQVSKEISNIEETNKPENKVLPVLLQNESEKEMHTRVFCAAFNAESYSPPSAPPNVAPPEGFLYRARPVLASVIPFFLSLLVLVRSPSGRK
jgi:hypothetical protein